MAPDSAGPATAAKLSQPAFIRSRDNPLLLRLRRLAQDGSGYRRRGQAWIEGEHLVTALHQRGGRALHAVFSEEAWALPHLRALAGIADRVAVVPAALFKGLSTLEAPATAATLGFVVGVPADSPIEPRLATVVLDRLQDAGNVGSILRSAAAFGAAQVLALKGTAALWSPKVLRAGMGAHFVLRLHESLDEAALDALQLPLVATSSHAGQLLPDAAVPAPCAWLLGHEGQGVSAALLRRAALLVRIPQPGGEESLNVAAAAAVCLYESARRAVPASAARPAQ